MRRGMLVVLGLCAALALGGCTQEAGPNIKAAPQNSDPAALQVKIKALMADECYADDPAATYQRCGKFFTQLASTVGSVDEELAGRSGQAKRAATELRSAVDSYQGQGCDAIVGQPSAEQRRQCPRALTAVHDSLDVLLEA